ncbi:hypothetical protein FA15DRAFT_678877 [Coprinopsis marcescibilis]|uniref:Zn(2)-C6 fungal-type domain-containing protein n=1 Tax=Coprinopsis marcescibilis TaxID=230819 RepID=A0A5C3L4T6_COPMA|nr:hypothetical protein FA15DRAFT_678877 [Coprinopsis marcescibilis]
MDSRDDDSLSSSLPSSLIPHLYTGPQDSSTRTTLADDFSPPTILPPLESRLPQRRPAQQYDQPEQIPDRNVSSSSTSLMDLAGAAVHQPAIPLSSNQRFGSPIYSDPVFHTSRSQPHSRPTNYSYSPGFRGDSAQAASWREGEAGPSSLLQSRPDVVWPSPGRQSWREGDVASPSFLVSREDPVWSQQRTPSLRDDVAPQPAWPSSSRLREEGHGVWQEHERGTGQSQSSGTWNSAFTHFGSGVSAPVGGERSAFPAEMGQKFADQDTYMAFNNPSQSLTSNTIPSDPSSAAFFTPHFPASGSGASGVHDSHNLHYSYSSPQLDTYTLPPPPPLESSEPRTLPGASPNLPGESHFGSFGAYQREDFGSVTSSKSKKHRSTSDSKEDSVRRPKTSVACDFCRGRKLRCDGDKPCSNCKGRGYTCNYVHFQRRRGPGKNPKGPRSKKRSHASAQGSVGGGEPTGSTPTSSLPSSRLEPKQEIGSASLFATPSTRHPNPYAFQTSPPELNDFNFRLSEAPRYPSTSFPSVGLSRARSPRSRATSSEDRSDAEEMYRKMG